MPSTIDDYFADQGLPLLLELQGVSITYTPAGGSGSSVTALVGKEISQEIEAQGQGDRTKKITRSVTCEAAAITGGINATVTIDSVEYEVDSIAEAEAGYVALSLVRDAAMEKARKQFRGHR